MLYPSIDELKKRADSRYTLVMIASKRSRDLIDGYPPLVNIGNEKPVSIATEEIAEDLISYTRRFQTEGAEEVEEEIFEPDGDAESRDLPDPVLSADTEVTETEDNPEENRKDVSEMAAEEDE